MHKILFTFSVLVVCLCGSSVFAITSDSNTWEGQYTGNVMPDSSGWTDNGNIAFYSSVMGGGILNLDTLGTNTYGWYSRACNFDFSKGATVEIRTQIYSSAPGAACVQLDDLTGCLAMLEFRENQIMFDYLTAGGGVNSVDVNMVNTDTLHTYRMAVLTDSNMVKIWVDSNTVPIITATLGVSGASQNTILFGDLTGTADYDSNWDINYVRFTKQGAFPPAKAQGYCGDGNHPRPLGDVNQDCIVNMLDLKIMAQNWLVDNRPK